MSDVRTYYADDRTREAIGDGRSCVLLVGSYMGFPNFGDVLQLKGALRSHAPHGGDRCPVLVLDIDSITDDGFAERVRRQTGVESLVFTSWSGVTGAPLGLSDAALPPIPRLHLYGGGFLNRMWGDYVLSLVEHVHERFGVSRYVISGQQVDTKFAARLKAHFERCPPVIAGGRDLISTKALEQAGAPAAYSFDDASEFIRELAGAFGGSPTGAAPHVLVHMNASGYTREGKESDQVEMLLDHLTRLLAHVGDDAQVTLLQAYTDRRTADIIDTLGVVQLLEDRSPLRRYQVAHLDRAALEAGVKGASAPRSLTPGPTIAMASSYHVSMLCAAMGVPCWMESRNDYYDQKRVGLGYGSEPFESFLESPTTRDLTSQFEARERWLPEFARVWDGDAQPRMREARAEADAPARQWFPKRSAPALRAALEARLSESETRAREGATAAEERLLAMHAHLTSFRAAMADVEARLDATESHRGEVLRALEQSQSLHRQALEHVTALERVVAEVAKGRDELRIELDQTNQRLTTAEATLASLRSDSNRIQNALRRESEALRVAVRDLSDRLATSRARVEMLQTLCERTKSRLSRIIA